MNTRGDIIMWILGFIVVTGVVLLIAGGITYSYTNNICENQLKDRGYDVVEVRLFCKSIGISFCDFKNSEAIKKHYVLYLDGITTDFVNRSISNNKAKNAENDGLITGIVIGGVGK